jgi:hypothetical protein
MAESEKQEGIKIPMPWGGDLVANGFNVIFVIAFVGVFYLLLEQNKLLGQQTQELRDGQEAIQCQLGIDIFAHSFPRGAVEWDLLPPILHGCLPEYSKRIQRTPPK